MALYFEKYAMKGNEFVNLLAHRLGDGNDRARAARILRSVFRALRNHLSIEDSTELISHLPMALKGVYVDGWKINQASHRTIDVMNLPAEIMREDGYLSKYDFKDDEEVMDALKTVLELIAACYEPNEAIVFDE
jgi:uncharacterized protein (DUF2267 family)